MRWNEIDIERKTTTFFRLIRVMALPITIFMLFLYLVATASFETLHSDFTRKRVQDKIAMSQNLLDSVSNLWLSSEVPLETIRQLKETNPFLHQFNTDPSLLIALYDRAELVYWNQPIFSPDTLLAQLKDSCSRFFFNNKISQAFMRENTSRKVVVVLMMTPKREEVGFYNQNPFNIPLFDITRYRITDDTFSGGIDIYDKDWNKCFSLLPISSAMKSILLDIFGWVSLLLMLYAIAGRIIAKTNSKNVLRQLLIALAIYLSLLSLAFLLNIPNRSLFFFFDPTYFINYDLNRLFGPHITSGTVIIFGSGIVCLFYTLWKMAPSMKEFFDRHTNRIRWIHIGVIASLFAFSVCCLCWGPMLTIFRNFSTKTIEEIFVFRRATLIVYGLILTIATFIPVLILYMRSVFSKKEIIATLIISSFFVVIANVLLNNQLYQMGYWFIFFNLLLCLFVVVCIHRKFLLSYVAYIAIVAALLTATVFASNKEYDSFKQRQIALSLYNNFFPSAPTPYSEILQSKDRKRIKNNYFTSLKMQNGKIIHYSGSNLFETDYEYNQKDLPLKSFMKTHLHYYLDGGDAVIVVSYPKATVLGMVSIWIYLFVLLLVGGCFFGMLMGFPEMLDSRSTLYRRIQFGLMSGMIVSALLIMFWFSRYSLSASESAYRQKIFTTFNSVIADYDQNVQQDKNNPHELVRWMQNIETKEGVNINIYDAKGRILYKSSEEACRNYLVSRRLRFDLVDAQDVPLDRALMTYSNFLYNYPCEYYYYKTQYADKEIYVQMVFYNEGMGANRKMLLDVLNIIIITTILTMLLSLFFYRQIMQPIRLIQESMQNIRYREKIENYKFRGDSEIGVMIEQYNRTIDELTETYAEISRHEKTDAWRMMARQVAHELKNPLTPMRLKAQLILYKKHKGDPAWIDDIDNTLQVIITQTEIMAKSISDFSAFGKMNDLVPTLTDIHTLCREIVDFYSCYMNVNIRYETSFNEELLANVDRETFWKVMSNIVANAVSAIGALDHPRDGEILVVTKVVERTLEIAVVDNGVGMSPEEQRMIFTPNFTTKTTGNGLGLVFCYQMLKNMGGKLSFESVPGVGTTFFIVLERSLPTRQETSDHREV